MPRTPIQNEPTKNPFITKTISKTLLTPCRQVGLSRKRKTPSSANSSFCGSYTETPQLETTPLSSNVTLIDIHSETENGFKPEVSQAKKKTKVSKRLIADNEEFLDTKIKERKCFSHDTIGQLENINATQNSNSETEMIEKSLKNSDKHMKRGTEEESLNRIEKDLDFKHIDNKSTSKTKSAKKSKHSHISKELNDNHKKEKWRKSEETQNHPQEVNDFVRQDSDSVPLINLIENSLENTSTETKITCTNETLNFVEIDSVLDNRSPFNLKTAKENKKSRVTKIFKEKKSKKSEKSKIKNDPENVISDDEVLFNLEKAGHRKLRLSPKKTWKGKAMILDSDEEDESEDIMLKNENSDKNVFEKVSEKNIGMEKQNEDNKNPEQEKSIDNFNENKLDENLKEQTVDGKEMQVETTALKDVTNDNLSKRIPESPTKNGQQSKKIKRSLSMKKSSGDFKLQLEDKLFLRECSISLSPLESKINLQEIPQFAVPISDLKELEKQIKEKKKLIDELKQAEIYKKKHDLTELQELTGLWKKACISALKDLLPLLQNLQLHTNIDMATLLKNLNIPKEAISLTANDELI